MALAPALYRQHDHDVFMYTIASMMSRPSAPDPACMRRRCALYALCAVWRSSSGLEAPSWRASTVDKLDRWAASLTAPIVVCPGGVARSSTTLDERSATATLDDIERFLMGDEDDIGDAIHGCGYGHSPSAGDRLGSDGDAIDYAMDGATLSSLRETTAPSAGHRRRLHGDAIAAAQAAINETLLHALVLAAVETGCAVDVASVCPAVGVDLFGACPRTEIVAVDGPHDPAVMDLAIVLVL